MGRGRSEPVAAPITRALPRGGLSVVIDPSAITGTRGVLLVPVLAPLLTDPDRVLVRSLLVEHELGAWAEREELPRGNAHADRWALFLIAGRGRRRE